MNFPRWKLFSNFCMFLSFTHLKGVSVLWPFTFYICYPISLFLKQCFWLFRGLITPSGLTSIPAGLETPDIIELRKRKEIEDLMEAGSETPSLYTVLHEKKTNVGASMMGSAHVYDLVSVLSPCRLVAKRSQYSGCKETQWLVVCLKIATRFLMLRVWTSFFPTIIYFFHTTSYSRSMGK